MNRIQPAPACLSCRRRRLLHGHRRSMRHFNATKTALLGVVFSFILLTGVLFQPACLKCGDNSRKAVVKCGPCSADDLFTWRLKLFTAFLVHLLGLVSISSGYLLGCTLYLIGFTLWTASLIASDSTYDLAIPGIDFRLRLTDHAIATICGCLFFDCLVLLYMACKMLRRRERRSLDGLEEEREQYIAMLCRVARIRQNYQRNQMRRRVAERMIHRDGGENIRGEAPVAGEQAACRVGEQRAEAPAAQVAAEVHFESAV